MYNMDTGHYKSNTYTVNPQIVAGVFYLFRLHSAPAFIWGRLVLGAGLYFLLYGSSECSKKFCLFEWGTPTFAGL